MGIFKISRQQKDEFFDKGYTSVKNGLSPELLKRLQDMAEKFEENIISDHKKGINTSEEGL